MTVPGAIATMSAAMAMKTPAEPARAPVGVTYTAVGTFDASRVWVIVSSEVRRPPGVSSSTISRVA